MKVMIRLVMVMMLAASTCTGGELELRGISLTRGYPKGEVFLHEENGGKAGIEVSVKSFLNHESEVIEAEGSLFVFTTEAGRESMGDASKVLGRIELPKGFRSGILLFFPGEEEEEGRVKLIEDTAKAFPVGAVKVVNLSNLDMKIELEDASYECKAGEELNIVDPPVRANNSSGMRAFKKEGEEWEEVMAGLWPHPGKKRVLQVVTRNLKSGKISMSGVRDIAKVGE